VATATPWDGANTLYPTLRTNAVALITTPWWNGPVTETVSIRPPASTTAPEAAGRSLTLWPAAPQRALGRRHGTSQSEPFDRWFRYPAGFASDYAVYLLSRLGIRRGETIVDCFAGCGVIGTAARASGLAFAGIEAHPMIAELAALKLQVGISPSEVRHAAQRAIRKALLVKSTRGHRQPRVEDHKAEPSLLGRSFAPETLSDLLALRKAVREERNNVVRPYLKWSLLACLRDVANVKVGWPYQRPGVVRKPRHTDVVQRFQQRVDFVVQDLGSLTDDGLERRVVVGDSRLSTPWAAALGDRLAEGCVSSPPYLNNFDYADATRLEAYFWGEVTSWAQLCARIRADMLTATTQQSSTGERQDSLAALSSSAIGEQVRQLTADLSTARRLRSRGKEYDQVIPAYFRAIATVLDNLAARLVPGAPVAWLVGDSAPYGVYVDTPALIGILSTDYGFETEADVALRERGRRWATPKNRHTLPLTERLLILRRQ
jgi:hypothetical protein